jgi:hypothetical protein
MEWWSDGFKPQYSFTPLLQHPILFARLASEIFLSSLKSEFFGTLLTRIIHTVTATKG